MNKVILVGNLARDPDIRQTPNGVTMARFTVAVSRRFAKEGQQQTDFISCVAWRQQADFLGRYFQKGSSLQLCGSIQTRSWDGSDGTKHYATDVVADEISFNGPKRDNPASAQGQGQNQDNGYRNNYQNSYHSEQSAPQNTPAPEPEVFDESGFTELDGSEDDLPF